MQSRGGFCRAALDSVFRFVSCCIQVQLCNHHPSCFYLPSGIQFQFLPASCGVQGSVRGLQAPAEPADGGEPHLARWTWTEDGRGTDGEAAAAAGHRGPAGTEPLMTSTPQAARYIIDWGSGTNWQDQIIINKTLAVICCNSKITRVQSGIKLIFALEISKKKVPGLNSQFSWCMPYKTCKLGARLNRICSGYVCFIKLIVTTWECRPCSWDETCSVGFLDAPLKLHAPANQTQLDSTATWSEWGEVWSQHREPLVQHWSFGLIQYICGRKSSFLCKLNSNSPHRRAATVSWCLVHYGWFNYFLGYSMSWLKSWGVLQIGEVRGLVTGSLNNLVKTQEPQREQLQGWYCEPVLRDLKRSLEAAWAWRHFTK